MTAAELELLLLPRKRPSNEDLSVHASISIIDCQPIDDDDGDDDGDDDDDDGDDGDDD